MQTPKSKTVKLEILSTKLKEVSEIAFVEVCGLHPEPSNINLNGSFSIEAMVLCEFWGPAHGKLKISLFGKLLGKMANGMLGENVTEQDQQGVLKEISNIICGQFLAALEYEQSFTIGSPHIIELSRAETVRKFIPTVTCKLEFATGTSEIMVSVVN